MKQGMRISLLAIVLLTVLIMSACGQSKVPEGGSQSSAPPTSEEDTSKDTPEDTPKTWDEAPELAIDPAKKYTATFRTSKGDFEVELFADSAPETVNNFVFLSREGYYDDVIFHRIIETFMIQGGDPTGTGMGGPGYNIPDEFENTAQYKYEPGIIAMANTGAPNSAGSQFFIVTGTDAAGLPPKYAIFGKVVSGMDNVTAIAQTPVQANSHGEPSQPTETVTIETIEINEQ